MSDPGKIDGRRARRIATVQALVAAVGETLRQDGMDKVGVNALAARAGVDKALIYRYFGGLKGLLRAYAETADFWPSVDELLGPDNHVLDETDPAVAFRRIMHNHRVGLQRRPQTLEILGFEMNGRNELTIVLEEIRQEHSNELAQKLLSLDLFAADDLQKLNELGALLTAAINYLTVRGRDIQMFGALQIGDEQAWEHVEDLFEAAARGVLSG